MCVVAFFGQMSNSTVLSFMSVCVCWAVILSLASIYSSLLTQYFSLGIHSCMVYILLLAVSALYTLYILCSSS